MKNLFFAGLVLLCLGQTLPALTLTYSSKNYANLQTAVDALSASTDAQKTLFLPSGNYSGVLSVSDNLTIESNCTIATILSGSGQNAAILTVNGNVFVNLRKIFFLNSTKGVEFKGLSQGNVNNCIFSMGNINTALIAESTTSVNIVNNTFYQNKVAVQANVLVGLQNNIFSQSGNSLLSLVSDNNVTHNLFMDENDGNRFGSANIRGSANFVSANLRDFHLLAGSLAINAGNNVDGLDDLDATVPDLGAYGGPYADTIPQDISSLVLSSTSLSASSLNMALVWNSNLDYQVKGYYLYYDTDQFGEPYSGKATGMGASPLDVGLVTSAILNPVSIAIPIDATPTITSLVQRNQSLVVNWTSAANTTGYLLQYRVSGSTDAYTDMELGLVNTATITGLNNSVVYEVRVSGLSRPTIYFAVAAYYSSNLTLNRLGSLISAKTSYQAPSATLSNPSTSVTASPEITQGFPLLPNNGGGCLLKGERL